MPQPAPAPQMTAEAVLARLYALRARLEADPAPLRFDTDDGWVTQSACERVAIVTTAIEVLERDIRSARAT